ncbi:hypothetical protein JTE90_005930 [Oedothorax gibbosus]|uniref:Ubiquitin-like modifier-activating enzyme ATG7 n=1 Tax=Oedothorax gibbosus TaxID=931172 RepID=A0AAV6U9Q1_9ARAC|nr:hypothetical protein JTE90_005930 [Oedothorax gibbosus]
MPKARQPETISRLPPYPKIVILLSERMSPLQFAPFSSAVDSGFWYQLTQKKLDVFKLDDGPVDMSGFYSTSSAPGLPPVFHVDYSALESSGSRGSVCCVSGTLLNTNTLEDFKRKDKRMLLQENAQQKIWAAIEDGRALQDPSLLQHCLFLTFADLKKYHYYYWMAFPALTFPKDVICEKEQKLTDCFSQEKLERLEQSLASLDPCDRGAFLVGDQGCHPLRERDSLKGKILLGFTDPSGFAKHPGWPLRNLLAFAAHQWGGNSWEVVCFRGKAENSLLLSLRTEGEPTVNGVCPEAVGWEMSKGKLVPKKVDMSESMDPHKLACNAVDLNLKLMRWRLSPGLELERIKDTKCLLFGAGTLGCNVARCLMGWGVRHLTLLDNSKVSYSNPVRQSLFTFEDCKKGGVHKATAAAQHLREVFPGVEATGKVLSVPMPGHAVPESMWPQVKNDVAELEELVSSHDVLFLLMDTRESRWLPSLLAAHHNKLVLNAALGFDTFLVMRHGMRKEREDETPHLGCYFCNDVVAPGNSSADRTLDQQCTVTRPGLSYVGAAMAVELLVSLLQHPLRGLAPASKVGECGEGELGLVPHQVRGHLHNFSNSILASQGFDRCTTCSQRVLECYRREGSDFLLRVFNDPDHLEKATGLSELLVGLKDDEIIALSDEDSC